MKRVLAKLALVVLGLAAAPVHASYLFDGSNDRMTGTLTSTYGNPITLACFVKVTAHPTAIDSMLSIGASNSSVNGTYRITTTANDNEWQAAAIADGGGAVGATRTQDIDNTWTGIVVKFTNDSQRDVYVGSLANTTQNTTTSGAISDAMQFLVLGENMTGTQDFTGRLAECAIWDVALSDANITSYMGGTVATDIDASNLIGYWPFDASNATQANEGVDTAGDLSVTGAVFDADHPTITGGDPAAFDTPPSVSAETTSVYTLSYNADANSVTFFAMAKVKDASAPADCDAVEAGTGAVATASEAVTGGADTTDLTISGGDPFPLYDLYGCVEGADGDSAVTALADETLDVPTGRQYVVKSGSPGVGEDGILDGASPASADGDYIDGPTACDSFAEGAAANALTINADTTYIIDTDGDTSRQTCTRRFYDVSVADWSDADPVALYVNNQAPVYVGLDDQGGSIDPYLFEIDIAFDYDVTELFTDAEGDTLSLSVTDNPSGGTVSGNDWEGTFDTCGVNAGVDFEATDIAGDTDSATETVTVGARVPDVLLNDEATATSAIEALCSLTAAAGSASYSQSVAAGLVISTDPVANELVVPDEEVVYILSLGEAPGGEDAARKTVFVIADDSGLVRWVDYIPVSDVPGCVPGTYENNGCWAVDVIDDETGLTPWVDYTPVFEVSQTANKWRYENDGWVPVDTLTP